MGYNDETLDYFGKKLTRKQKEKNNKQYYRDYMSHIDGKSFFKDKGLGEFGDTRYTDHQRMKINYDLVNNIINKKDFEYVCAPLGTDVGELPANFSNKNIVTGKINSLIGMEMKRKNTWMVLATNEQATTRKEQEHFGKLKDFVISSIMTPIQQQLEQQAAEESKRQELSEEEKERINQQVAEQLKAMTPEEVKKYMEREHQDPAEVLFKQLLRNVEKQEDTERKFLEGWKHGIISAYEIFFTYEKNKRPKLKVINPIRFDFDRDHDSPFIHHGLFACYEEYVPLEEIMMEFGDELTKHDIDQLKDDVKYGATGFTSLDLNTSMGASHSGVRKLHCEWKALSLICFLSYIDENGELQKTIVDEEYELNPEIGDILIEEEWILKKHHGYRLNSEVYVSLGEVPYQNKSMDDIYDCNLSYLGVRYDYMNSEPTSFIDRMKDYQYLYNIVMHRAELLIHSDKGKVLAIHSGLIPSKGGLSTEDWIHFGEKTKYLLLNDAEEGSRGSTDISKSVKEIDLSLASNIMQYIELAQYIEKRCGDSVGITSQIEGQIGAREAVRNTQQAIVQSANILEPYFELHNILKRDVLDSLLNLSASVYSRYQPEFLNFVLDDMSKQMLEIDYDLLSTTTYGLYFSNAMKTTEALDMVQQLSHAALQNQKVELSDVIKIMKSDSVQEAEELLLVAEKDRQERDQAMQQQQMESQEKMAERAREWEKELLELKHQNDKEIIQLKGDIDILRQVILAMGFNEDKDMDNDGVPDVLEVAKHKLNAQINEKKTQIEEKKLAFKEKEMKSKERIEKAKLKKGNKS